MRGVIKAHGKMKILIINTRHYPGGGDSTYTFNLAELLKQHGHEVSFFAMQDERNIPDPNADLFVSNIDFRELNKRKNLNTGIRVIARSIYSFEAKKKFSLLIDRVKPDIIHLQNIHAHITPSVIMEAKKQGLPVVWTLHDYKLICPNSHFLIDADSTICEACQGGRFYQAVIKSCKKNSFFASAAASFEAYIHAFLRMRDLVDVFLTPSAFLRGKLLINGYQPEKVIHLPLFLPNEQFCQSEKDESYLLFLGKLETLKGIYQLLEACRQAPDVHLVLAGRIEEPLKSLLPGLLPPNAVYVGLKQGDELKRLRANALALILPSICYENQPFSILEAFASSKPVIASNLGGMKELVKDHEQGLLVEPRDPRSLASAMKWLVEHPVESHKWGYNAFQYAMTNHSPEIHYEKLEAIYKNCLLK